MEGAGNKMKAIFYTRFLHWKKQWPALLFWLSLPIFATLIIITISTTVKEEAKIPVGIVVHEQSKMADDLIQSITTGESFIRTYQLDEATALHQLEKHELDSVFIIEKNYEEQIRKGNRNQLIKSYQSDLSFAYTPVKEMIVSLVQQETGRSKAAHVVQQLGKQLHSNHQWTWDEITETSKAIQKEENLLNTTFSYANANKEDKMKDNTVMLDTWSIWALFSLLCTLLLFDWLIKEQQQQIKPRFAFIRISYPNYLLANSLLYIIFLFLFDIISLLSFYFVLNEPITLTLIAAIASFRLMIGIGTFLLVLLFRNTFIYYCLSFILTLYIAISSGAILPIEGITTRYEWLRLFNPLDKFLSGEMTIGWTILLLVIAMVWYGKKVRQHA